MARPINLNIISPSIIIEVHAFVPKRRDHLEAEFMINAQVTHHNHEPTLCWVWHRHTFLHQQLWCNHAKPAEQGPLFAQCLGGTLAVMHSARVAPLTPHKHLNLLSRVAYESLNSTTRDNCRHIIIIQDHILVEVCCPLQGPPYVLTELALHHACCAAPADKREGG